jgi:hypothetical protein
MNDQRDFDHKVEEWLKEVPPHDDLARRDVLTAVPTTRQRRFRWLPAVGFGRPPRRGGVLRLTNFAAGLIVMLALGAIVLGLPGLDPNRIIGPAASPVSTLPPVATPAEFRGRILCSFDDLDPGVTEHLEVGTVESPMVRSESRGARYIMPISQISDPRLDGVLTNAWDHDEYRQDDGVVTHVGVNTWRIENAWGAWEGSFPNLVLPGEAWATTTFPMFGEGAFDGLVALWSHEYNDDARCSWNVRGLIVRGELPAFPEPAP